MTSTSDADPESERFLKSVEALGAIAGLLGAVALVVGGWIGVVTMTATRSEPFGRESHPTLGIGVAVITLSIALAGLAAAVSWMALTCTRPRLAAIANYRHEEAARLQLEGL